jgi:hypothetical protein
MDPRIHSEIANKLERAKASGLIHDYFVSWVGWDGRLDPVVRGWTDSASAQVVRERIATLLSGLVSERNVRVAAE